MQAAPDTSSAIVSIPNLSRVSVPAAAAGTPGAVGPFDIVWPSFGRTTHLMVIPADGLAATLAGLSLEIFDEQERPIATDRIGVSGLEVQPFSVPCLSMMGLKFRPLPFERTYEPGNRWRIRVQNFTAGAIVLASVSIWVVAK